MASTPGALHLRTLSTLNDLSSDQSNTIIFALPIEILRAFDGKNITEEIKKISKKMSNTVDNKDKFEYNSSINLILLFYTKNDFSYRSFLFSHFSC